MTNSEMQNSFDRSSTYQPKGSMCMTCSKQKQDCSNLPFEYMKKHEIKDSTVIVICSEFRKKID